MFQTGNQDPTNKQIQIHSRNYKLWLRSSQCGTLNLKLNLKLTSHGYKVSHYDGNTTNRQRNVYKKNTPSGIEKKAFLSVELLLLRVD